MADNENKKSITEQKKAVAEELSYMLSNRGNYPEDYSTHQEMSRLTDLYNELSAKEKLLEKEGKADE